MNKRHIGFLLALALIFPVLTGCGTAATTASSSAAQNPSSSSSSNNSLAPAPTSGQAQSTSPPTQTPASSSLSSSNPNQSTSPSNQTATPSTTPTKPIGPSASSDIPFPDADGNAWTKLSQQKKTQMIKTIIAAYELQGHTVTKPETWFVGVLDEFYAKEPKALGVKVERAVHAAAVIEKAIQ